MCQIQTYAPAVQHVPRQNKLFSGRFCLQSSIQTPKNMMKNWSLVSYLGNSASGQTNQLTAAWQAGLAHAQENTFGVRNMAASWALLGGIRRNWAPSASEWENWEAPAALRGGWGAEGRLRITPVCDITGKRTPWHLPLSSSYLLPCLLDWTPLLMRLA